MIKLINANLSDAKLLIKIHREAVSKGYLRSIHSNFKFKIFSLWLKYKLFVSKSPIFIGKYNNCKFGFVRFDLFDKKATKFLSEFSLNSITRV